MRGLLNCSVLYGSSKIIRDQWQILIIDQGAYRWHILYPALCYIPLSDRTFSEHQNRKLAGEWWHRLVVVHEGLVGRGCHLLSRWHGPRLGEDFPLLLCPQILELQS